MSTEPENVDPLVSLLKSKQAPPASDQFFNRLASRIKAGIEHPPAEAPRTWWERLAKDIDLKACVTGVSVCTLMLVGIFYAMRQDAPSDPMWPYTAQSHPGVITPATWVATPAIQNLRQPAAERETAPSTAPVMQQEGTNSMLIPVLPSPSPVNLWQGNP